MPENTCTWLHLSDLHFRESDQWDSDIVLKKLLEDVEGRLEEGFKPDLVFITGDLAYSGKPTEYQLAGRFLDQLRDKTGLGKDRVFVVPGNHDVSWPHITPAMRRQARGFKSEREIIQHVNTPEDRRGMFGKLRPFTEFVNTYLVGCLQFDDTNYYYVRFVDAGRHRIAILGLNSAWMCTGDEKQGEVTVGEHQVRQALDEAKSANIRIALVHHPFDWLHDFDREKVESLLLEGCDFILHGHMHQSGTQQLRTPDASAMVIAGGACYSTREYPNTYNLVRLDLREAQGTAVLRRYGQRDFWVADNQTYRNVPDGKYVFPLTNDMEVHLDADPGTFLLSFEPPILDCRNLMVSRSDWPEGHPLEAIAATIDEKLFRAPAQRRWRQVRARGGKFRLSITDDVWLNKHEATLRRLLQSKLDEASREAEVERRPKPRLAISAEERARADELFKRGREAAEQAQWKGAIDLLERVLEIDPGREEAARLLRVARDEQKKERDNRQKQVSLETLYIRAREYLLAKQWDNAEVLLEDLANADGGYKDSPELLMQVRDQIRRQGEENIREQELDSTYQLAIRHYEAGEWGEAVRFLTRIITDEQSEYRDARKLLHEALRNQELETRYAEALEAEELAEWEQESKLLEGILALTGQEEYRDVKQRLEAARSEHRLSTRYAAAEDDLNAGRWDAARRKLDRITAERSEYRDTAAATAYARAHLAMEAEDWEGAREELRAVVRAGPRYRDAAALLRDVKVRAQLKRLRHQTEVQWQAGAWGEVQRTLEDILALQPEDNETRKRLEEARIEEALAKSYERAGWYRERKLWSDAIQLLEEILQHREEYRGTRELLEEARRQRDIAELFEKGTKEADNGQWRDAIRTFEAIAKRDPDYRDIQERLEGAKRKKEMVEAYEAGMAAYRAGEWPKAIERLQRVIELQPSYLDAATTLADAKKQKELSEYYADGLNEMNAAHWEEAAGLFKRVADIEPNYREAARKLEESRSQAEWARTYADAQIACRQGAWSDAIRLLEQLPDGYDGGVAPRKLEEARVQQQLDETYQEATTHYRAQRWPQAIELLAGIEERSPKYRDVEAMLKEARRQVRLDDHYQAGMVAFQAGQWDKAAVQFAAVVHGEDGDVDYRDALTRLSAATRAGRLEQLYREGQSRYEHRQWPAAIQYFKDVLLIDDQNADVKERLRSAQEQYQLQQWYEEGNDHLEAGRWEKAREAFAKVGADQAAYPDADEKLKLAEQELHLARAYETADQILNLGRWSEAIEQLQQVIGVRPNYRDAATKLETAQQNLRLAALWSQVQKLGPYPKDVPPVSEEQAWRRAIRELHQAIGCLKEIVAANPDYADGQARALLDELRPKLEDAERKREEYTAELELQKQQLQAEAERQRQLRHAEEERQEEIRRAGEALRQQQQIASLYTRVRSNLADGRFKAARSDVQRILELVPDDQEAQALYRRARHPGLRGYRLSLGLRAQRITSTRLGKALVIALPAAVAVLCLAAGLASLAGNKGATATPTERITQVTSQPSTLPLAAPSASPAPAQERPTSTAAPTLSPVPTNGIASITDTAPPVSASPTQSAAPPASDTPAPPPPIATTRAAPPATTVAQSATPKGPTPVPPAPPTDTATIVPPPPVPPKVAGKLAFPVYDPQRRSYDVYLADAGGTNRRPLVLQASQPELSPDGKMIAYRSWNNSTRGIVVMSLDGAYRFNATNFLEDARPSWATNQSLVFFSRRDSDRNSRIYLDGAWADAETRLIQHGPAPAFGEAPSWLGVNRIVYSLCNPQCGIFVTDPNGAGPTRLLDDPGKTAPEGSPDGTRIAFMSKRDGNWEIYVVGISSGNVKRLTSRPAIDGLPIWSPDGSYVAFVSNHDGSWAIWIIKPDGSGLSKLFDLGGSIDGVVDDEPYFSSAGWMEEQISWAP